MHWASAHSRTQPETAAFTSDGAGGGTISLDGGDPVAFDGSDRTQLSDAVGHQTPTVSSSWHTSSGAGGQVSARSPGRSW